MALRSMKDSDLQAFTRRPRKKMLPAVASIAEGREIVENFRRGKVPLPPKGERRKEVVRWLHEYDGGNCGICFTPIDLTITGHHPGVVQLDHIDPRAGGGADTWDNIQITHSSCNALKSSFYEGYESGAVAAERLRISIDHWENPEHLVRDYKAALTRLNELSEKIRALLLERAQFSESDSRYSVMSAEISTIAVARMQEERVVSTYVQRLLAYMRRVKKSRDQKQSPQ